GKFAVFFFCDTARNEDSEMADRLVDGIDYRLSVSSDLINILIKIENPAERLLWRRNIVTLRAEYYDRGANIAKIDPYALRCFNAAGSEVVADEQLIDDKLNLFGIEIDVAAPPALEFE